MASGNFFNGGEGGRNIDKNLVCKRSKQTKIFIHLISEEVLFFIKLLNSCWFLLNFWGRWEGTNDTLSLKDLEKGAQGTSSLLFSYTFFFFFTKKSWNLGMSNKEYMEWKESYAEKSAYVLKYFLKSTSDHPFGNLLVDKSIFYPITSQHLKSSQNVHDLAL